MGLWRAKDTINVTIAELIANNFPLLAGMEDKILVLFKEKATNVGDIAVMGKTSKASPVLNALDENQEWKFVITLAADTWDDLTPEDQRALLFHHLCACGAVEDESTGDIKTFVRLPDVSFFREEVEQFGFWRTSGSTPEADTILDLFGQPKAPPTPAPTPAKKPRAKKNP